MRITIALLFSTFACSAVIGSDEPDITGTCVRWNPRTVIGTGQTDTVLRISGLPGDLYVEYTSGRISRIKDSEGRFILKTSTVTFSRIPIVRKNDLFVFSVPGQNQSFRLTAAMVDGKKALVEPGTDALPFLKKEDNEAGDTDKK